MKRIFCVVVAICMFAAVDAQQLTTAQPSPTQTLKQNFGLASIELSYSRPSLKGRTLFVDLAPYGSVWRTGANNATTLTFADEVTIGGKKIPAGKYGLLSIPGQNEWTLIITKQLDVTSPEAYKQENDVVRVMAKPMKLNDKVETFTIQFANMTTSSTDLQLLWGNTVVTLPITTETDKKVMAQIDNLLNKDTKPYFNAAMYYMDNNKDLNQAVSWFDKAIEQNPKSVTAYYQKANALVKLGKKDEAKKAATKSLELAKDAKNTNYVQLNEKLLSGLK
ncbi:MAG: Tetratricopeptide 2 repeat-containing protein [Segetibacter sp.]|nr:Tetratricopeptide 2 repeat-containing protein [Segetibacter sp.]